MTTKYLFFFFEGEKIERIFTDFFFLLFPEVIKKYSMCLHCFRCRSRVILFSFCQNFLECLYYFDNHQYPRTGSVHTKSPRLNEIQRYRKQRTILNPMKLLF